MTCSRLGRVAVVTMLGVLGTAAPVGATAAPEPPSPEATSASVAPAAESPSPTSPIETGASTTPATTATPTSTATPTTTTVPVSTVASSTSSTSTTAPATTTVMPSTTTPTTIVQTTQVLAPTVPPPSALPAPDAAAATKPSAPASLTAEPTNRSGEVRLTWTPPESDGGAPVTDYRLRRYDGTSAVWTTIDDGVGTSTSYTVTGLVDGRWYNFAVDAVNEAGTGPYVSAMARPRTLPSAPASFSAVPTYRSGEVRLTWTPPTSDGGAAVTDYVLRRYDGTTAVWTTIVDGVGTATSYTVSGLVNGRTYNFIVSATTAAGTGPYFSRLAMPRTVPSAPRSLSAVPTYKSGEVRLTWTAPLSNGGVPVLDYVIQRSPNGSSTWTTISDGTGTATSYTVTGLTNGTTYHFRVLAKNQVGSGPVGNVAQAMPRTVPSAPRSLGVSSTNVSGQIRLTWTAPASNGGVGILDYVIQRSPDGSSNWATLADGTSTATSSTVTGLTNGTRYYFRVFARNQVGTSVASSVVSTFPGRPSPPTSFTVAAFADGYDLTWGLPANNGGYPIRGYVAQRYLNGTWTTLHSGLWTSTSGWVNATGYGCDDFRVAAVNTLGTGVFAYAWDCYPPGTPQYFQGYSVWETGDFHLHWYEPADTDWDQPFDGYVLQYSNDGVTWHFLREVDFGTTEVDVPGSGGPCRNFRVAAFVGNALSPWAVTRVC